jgi:hypothetical protein
MSLPPTQPALAAWAAASDATFTAIPAIPTQL